MVSNSQAILALNASNQIGPKTFQILSKVFNKDFTKVWKLKERELRIVIPKQIIERVIDAKNNYSYETEEKKLKNINADYLTILDPEYPNLLKEIYNPPFVIYYKGDVTTLNTICIAAVGSRKFTPYGRIIGRRFGCDLAKAGLTVASGLALGLDAIIHHAAVEADGLTIGVLACGIDKIYPAQNYQLAKKIIDGHGIIISEQPPGTLPMKQNFPSRNRIISGLSVGTLVIEATQASGSLITAACALEQNRDVFAIPGNIDSENSLGTNTLIKNGAYLVTTPNDILDILNIKPLPTARKNILISKEEQQLLDSIKDGNKHIDKIAETSKLDIVYVSEKLTLMEIKGAIVHSGGGYYDINI